MLPPSNKMGKSAILNFDGHRKPEQLRGLLEDRERTRSEERDSMQSFLGIYIDASLVAPGTCKRRARSADDHISFTPSARRLRGKLSYPLALLVGLNLFQQTRHHWIMSNLVSVVLLATPGALESVQATACSAYVVPAEAPSTGTMTL